MQEEPSPVIQTLYCSGRVGGQYTGSPLIKVELHPDDLIIKAPLQDALILKWHQMKTVIFHTSILASGIEIFQSKNNTTGSARLNCGLDGDFAVAFKEILDQKQISLTEKR